MKNSRQLKTVSDLIDALESFRRHHGDNAPIHMFALSESADSYTFPISSVAEVNDDSSDFWGAVDEPTLLIF